jgi:hypothetical protein
MVTAWLETRTRAVSRCVAITVCAVIAGLGCSREQPSLTALASQRPSFAQANLDAFSGQRAFGQATVEPSFSDADGSTVFLLTPSKSPLPSQSNPRASAPMFIPMYPASSTIDPATLNCQPHNCDHLNVLPFPAPGYPNGGPTCAALGFPAGGCALVLGHDHLIGVRPAGDFNVAWHVILVVFTPQAFADGAINTRVTTLQDVRSLEASGDAFEASTPITFNCSIVSEAVYVQGTPLTF